MRIIGLALLVFYASTTVGCGAAVGQTTAPPWLGKELHTSPSDLSGLYQCGAQTAGLRLTSAGTFGAPHVERWTFADDTADPSELARWNDWLQELAVFTSHSVSCDDGYAAVFVSGLRRGDGEPYAINVFWTEGELWRMPASADEYRRAEQESWFPR